MMSVLRHHYLRWRYTRLSALAVEQVPPSRWQNPCFRAHSLLIVAWGTKAPEKKREESREVLGSPDVVRIRNIKHILRRWLHCGIGAASIALSLKASAQHAPIQFSSPWQTPTVLAHHQVEAAGMDARTFVRGEHPYTLPELIDLAEGHNPATRSAWEAAKAQAGQLHVAQSDLLPALTALANANTTRQRLLISTAYVRQTLGLFSPVVQVNYLLFDFGGRSGGITRARQQLLEANFNFNAVHLTLIFETSRRYYQLLNAIGQRDAAEVNFRNAETVRKAVDARLAVGLATIPDALQARAASAQANFELQTALGLIDLTRSNLLSIIGASEQGPLDIEPLANLQIPDTLQADVRAATERSLLQRPELGERTAERDAARAQIKQARSAFFPDLTFDGEGRMTRAYARQDLLSDVYTGPVETWNVNLSLRWEIFDGGRREGELSSAHAEERGAQAEIDRTRDEIEDQVWNAYVTLRTAFSQRDAAAALVQAAQISYTASLRAYQQGVRNTVDVVAAQRALSQAMSADVTARTGLLTQLSTFAYRTGDLLQTAARKTHP